MKQKMKSDKLIQDTILQLLEEQGQKFSICPSLVAKALEPDERLWRRLLKPIRQQAALLAQADMMVITRKGKPQDPNAEIKGIIRFARAENTQPEA